MNPYDDKRDRPEPEPPEVYVRCLACNEAVEASFFDIHVAEECDGAPLYEEF